MKPARVMFPRNFALLALGSMLALALPSAGANPIIRHLYTADPAARVFGDRIYVYTSHDEKDAAYFDMWDWRLFSTADLVTATPAVPGAQP